MDQILLQLFSPENSSQLKLVILPLKRTLSSAVAQMKASLHRACIHAAEPARTDRLGPSKLLPD